MKFFIPLICFLAGIIVGGVGLSLASKKALTADRDPHLLSDKDSAEKMSPAAPLKPSSEATNPLVVKNRSTPLWKFLALAGKRSGPEGNGLKLPPLTAPYNLSEERPVTDEFAAFFNLTAGERGQLDVALQNIYARQKDYELKVFSTVSPTDPQSDLGIKISPYPEKGAEFYDQLQKELLSILGEERSAFLKDWSGEDLEKNLTGVGLYEREMWIRRPNADNTSWTAIYWERGPNGHSRQFTTTSPTIGELEQAVRFPISKLPHLQPAK